MINLDGRIIYDFPFPDLEIIEILVYRELPSTILYTNEHRDPIILEWVDCSDDGENYRYLIYQTSAELLSEYLSGVRSHYSLLESAIDSLIFAFEGDLENKKNIQIVPFKNLPAFYLPKKEVFPGTDDTVDLTTVVSYFV